MNKTTLSQEQWDVIRPLAEQIDAGCETCICDTLYILSQVSILTPEMLKQVRVYGEPLSDISINIVLRDNK